MTTNWRWGWAAVAAVALMSLARPAPGFDPFGSGFLRSAFEPGLEGWFQQYVSPSGATANGLKITARYHLLSLGRFVPYLEGTAGAGGTSLRVPEINSTFTFVLEAG